MRGNSTARYWPGRTAGYVLGLALVLAGCTQPPTPQAAAPVAAGAARVWFYRDYEPSVSRNSANVALNGVSAGSLPPYGTAIYRDVAPGRYRVSVESEAADANQAKDVELASGQEAFVKIQASDSWESGGDQTMYSRDTFYVKLMPPQVARIELAAHPVTGG